MGASGASEPMRRPLGSGLDAALESRVIFLMRFEQADGHGSKPEDRPRYNVWERALLRTPQIQ
jgi:hypothetical protein